MQQTKWVKSTNPTTDPLFGMTKLLKINDLYTTTSLRNIKKAHLGQTPQVIQEIFKIQDSERPLRTPNNIKPLINSGRIHYDLPKIWNSLDEDLKGKASVKSLLRTIKDLIIEEYTELSV